MRAPVTRGAHPFSRLRWLGLGWLVVYLPSYALAYGWANFLFLCNLGVMITAVALWAGSVRWLSAQALAALPIGLVWAVDFGGGLLLGEPPLALTSYMWDPQYPLFTRALSLYHVAWPLLLGLILRRHGYDRRGWALQSGVALVVLPLSRWLTPPAENVNFAYSAPWFDRPLGPAPLHLALVGAATVLGLYGATHWLLDRLFVPAPARRGAAAPAAPGAAELLPGAEI